MQLKTDVANLSKDIESGAVINKSGGLSEAKRIKEKRLEIESYGERITNIENTLNTILELLQQKGQ